MKWRFVRSLDVRAGGPRCGGRERRCADFRWMQALKCRTRDRRMVPPMEANLGGAARIPCTPFRLARVRLARRSTSCFPEFQTLTFRYLGVQTRPQTHTVTFVNVL